MLDAWWNRTRDWLQSPEKLLSLPEQEFVSWAMSRALRSAAGHRRAASLALLWGESGCGISSLLRLASQPANTGRRNLVVASAAEWSAWLADEGVAGFSLTNQRMIDLMVCDHLEDLIDPQADGDRLATWIDVAHAERIPILVTCNRLPAQIAGLSPRLLNRLHGGLLAGVRPLGDDSKQRLWNHWTTRTGAQLPLARQVGDHRAVVAAGSLRRLWEESRRSEDRPQRPSAGERVVMTLEFVAAAVARDFDISQDELRSRVRAKQLQIPRRLAMTLARELTPHSLTTIGRFFGCRSHTAVTRSCARLQQLLPDAPSLRQQLQLLRARLRQDVLTDCG